MVLGFLDSAGFRAIALAALILLLYTIYGIVYRLYLSPIVKFPGPKLAAVTFWYEFYYDVVKRGRYTWAIGEMHDKYGPIVRINPYELHVRDHRFLDTLYPLQTKSVEKWPWSMRTFGHLDTMTFATTAHTLHHQRRRAIGPFFAKQFIVKSDNIIQRNVDKLCQRLEECGARGLPVNLLHQFSGMTGDVASEFAFGVVFNSPDEANYGERSYTMWMGLSEYGHTMKQFPWLIYVLEALPEWLTKLTDQVAWDSLQIQKHLVKRCAKLLSKKPDEKRLATSTTILESLYNNPEMPDSEKSEERMIAEAQMIIGAGTLTVAHALSVGIYHLLANPPILEKLRAEVLPVLRSSEVDLFSLRQLENLPYLLAVIYEAMRMSYGVTHRLQRVHPDTPLKYESWTIPPGTPIGMTNLFMCDDPAIFPEPRAFKPERWMGTDAPNFFNTLNVFGRGTRQCAGLHLAFAEIRLALAALVTRFAGRMQLHNVVRERDIDLYHDFFNPSAKAGVKEGCVVMIEKKD